MVSCFIQSIYLSVNSFRTFGHGHDRNSLHYVFMYVPDENKERSKGVHYKSKPKQTQS